MLCSWCFVCVWTINKYLHHCFRPYSEVGARLFPPNGVSRIKYVSYCSANYKSHVTPSIGLNWPDLIIISIGL